MDESTLVNFSCSGARVEESTCFSVNGPLLFCLIPILGCGLPVISPSDGCPVVAYSYITSSLHIFIGKRFRINSDFDCGSLRYHCSHGCELNRVHNLNPMHLTSMIYVWVTFSILDAKCGLHVPGHWCGDLFESIFLSHSLQFDQLKAYYFILPFNSMLFSTSRLCVLVNGNSVYSRYILERSKTSLHCCLRKKTLIVNIEIQITGLNPFANALETCIIIDIYTSCSSITVIYLVQQSCLAITATCDTSDKYNYTCVVSALQHIGKSFSTELGWQDDPCFPITWKHFGCLRKNLCSPQLSNINLEVMSPMLSDLVGLHTQHLHTSSLSEHVQNLDTLQLPEIWNLRCNASNSFGYNSSTFSGVKASDFQKKSLERAFSKKLACLQKLHSLGPANSFIHLSSLNYSSLSTVSITQTLEDGGLSMRAAHHRHGREILIIILVCGVLTTLIISILGLPFPNRNASAVRRFSFEEIKSATNNFIDFIGWGSSGSAYKGKLPSGKPVVVTIRHAKSQHWSNSFFNEVKRLSQVKHQNLVHLEGFCHESGCQILLYEYVPGRSLANYLYVSNSESTLNWTSRLKIALGAAKGISYLHNYVRPRIIHGYVNSGNILLDEEMNAKVSDFCHLRVQASQLDPTLTYHVVMETTRYLDPVYYSSYQLRRVMFTVLG